MTKEEGEVKIKIFEYLEKLSEEISSNSVANKNTQKYLNQSDFPLLNLTKFYKYLLLTMNLGLQRIFFEVED